MTAQSQGASALIPQELIVVIRTCDLGFTEFIGTRAMLEAEGILPQGTFFPTGFDDLDWKAGAFDYGLRRQRPPGAKGLRKQFADCDWFCLRWELTNQPSHTQREIACKTQELKDVIYRRSDKGAAEWSAQWDRYQASTKDVKFQAFKANIPGLVSPKRGHRPKSSDQAQGEAA